METNNTANPQGSQQPQKKEGFFSRLESDLDSHSNEINEIENRTGEVEGAIGEIENLRNIL